MLLGKRQNGVRECRVYGWDVVFASLTNAVNRGAAKAQRNAKEFYSL